MKPQEYQLGSGTFLVERHYTGTKRPVEIIEEKVIVAILEEKDFERRSRLC